MAGGSGLTDIRLTQKAGEKVLDLGLQKEAGDSAGGMRRTSGKRNSLDTPKVHHR